MADVQLSDELVAARAYAEREATKIRKQTARKRDLIRLRTGEGRERATARGVKLSRTPKLTPTRSSEIARSYNVHNSTISRLTA